MTVPNDCGRDMVTLWSGDCLDIFSQRGEDVCSFFFCFLFFVFLFPNFYKINQQTIWKELGKTKTKNRKKMFRLSTLSKDTQHNVL
mmetsp:Transcript_26522/g.67948  ORF Transcript_26522/g.67948 Transcript_26522/m.67948 type:complete len:86 (+) Transcript_26522:4460-4717(+)